MPFFAGYDWTRRYFRYAIISILTANRVFEGKTIFVYSEGVQSVIHPINVGVHYHVVRGRMFLYKMNKYNVHVTSIYICGLDSMALDIKKKKIIIIEGNILADRPTQLTPRLNKMISSSNFFFKTNEIVFPNNSQ